MDIFGVIGSAFALGAIIYLILLVIELKHEIKRLNFVSNHFKNEYIEWKENSGVLREWLKELKEKEKS